ncbi:hypothetical protein P8452_40736 [Trifolium repens]|nr:hypothetical protein P8452_40736 [Trifolium repens]
MSLGCNQRQLGLLEEKRKAWSASLEYRKQELKRLQDQSDPDAERIDSVYEDVQYMLSILENLDTEIKLEKQQEKKLRQIAKSGKQTTSVVKYPV